MNECFNEDQFVDYLGVTVGDSEMPKHLREKLNENICYGGKGGGGGQPTSSTVTQTDLPSYAKKYFEDLLQRTQKETKKSYKPYKKARTAKVQQELKQSEKALTELGKQQPTEIQAAQGTTEDIMTTDFGRAQAEQYMDPYLENVLRQQRKAAKREYRMGEAGRRAQEVQAGAMGGSRAGIQDLLARGQLDEQLMDIEATGRQKAFEQAQQQFERDRQAQLAAAGQLAGLGQAELADLTQRAGLLEGVGKAQMAREQQALDLAYQDYLRQRDYPREQLQFFSSILRGVPVSPSQEQATFTPVNPYQQLLGTGISGLSLYKALS